MSQKSKAKKPRKSRSGSEQRKLQPRITFRVDEPLRAKAKRDAAATGFTVGSYMRMLLGDECSMRPQRRPLPSEILLVQLKAEVGHVDGNLTQLLRKVNCGDLVPSERLDDACEAVGSFYRKATALLFGEL